MQPEFEKAQKTNPDRLEEYFAYVKNEVKTGGYFKDSLDWYMLRYVNPMVDRTIMATVSIIAVISLYFLIQIISSAFPLVEKVPVVIRDHDMSLYRPIISEVRDKHDLTIKNVDEAVAKYLLSTYIKDREAYDFRDSKVSEVNRKFTRVKNNSSYAEYKNFQLFMSRENVESPINNFGRNVYKDVKIQSVKFIRTPPRNKYEKFKWLFTSRIPKEAEIRFQGTINLVNKEGEKSTQSQNYLAKVRFTFKGLDRNAKAGVLNFVVEEYKLYRVK